MRLLSGLEVHDPMTSDSLTLLSSLLSHTMWQPDLCGCLSKYCHCLLHAFLGIFCLFSHRILAQNPVDDTVPRMLYAYGENAAGIVTWLLAPILCFSYSPGPKRLVFILTVFFTNFSKHGVGHGLGLPMALIGSSGVEKIDKYFKNIIITEAHWRPLSIAAYILTSCSQSVKQWSTLWIYIIMCD